MDTLHVVTQYDAFGWVVRKEEGAKLITGDPFFDQDDSEHELDNAKILGLEGSFT